MVCHGGIVLVLQLTEKSWIHSARHGLCPCARYSRGDIVVLPYEQAECSLWTSIFLTLTLRRWVRGSFDPAGYGESDP